MVGKDGCPRRLFLSRIDTRFDPSVDLAIGPWCFAGAEDIYPDWHKLDFIDALSDPARFQAADREACDLVSELVLDWGRLLNERHGTDQPLIYWRFLLIGWVLMATQSLYARFLHMEAFVAQYGDTPLDVELASEEIPARADGLIEFQTHLRRGAGFDYWMSSFILRRMMPESWRATELDSWEAWQSGEGDNFPEDHIALERPSRAGAVLRGLLGRLPVDSVPGMNISKAIFSVYLAVLPGSGFGRHLVDLNAGGAASVKPAFPPLFLELLNTFLEATLPRAYDEDYNKIFASVAGEKIYPGRLFVSNFMPSDERRRMLFARAAAGGEKLVSIQHGNGYGVHRWNPWASEFEYPYHAFLTWGWTRHQEHRGYFIPLPSPMLSKVANRHRETISTLALVGTKIDIRDVRIVPPRPSGIIAYREHKKTFLASLAPSPRGDVTYYAYSRGSSDLDDVDYLRNSEPDLRVKETGLNQDMLSMRLMVVDHLGTAINFGLAASTPTVCFWDPDAWLICADAEPEFDALRRCGILHDDPVSAARHINDIWDDVAGWWGGADVQAARGQWLSRHGRTSKFWWWPWLKTLTRLQLDRNVT